MVPMTSRVHLSIPSLWDRMVSQRRPIPYGGLHGTSHVVPHKGRDGQMDTDGYGGPYGTSLTDHSVPKGRDGQMDTGGHGGPYGTTK